MDALIMLGLPLVCALSDVAGRNRVRSPFSRAPGGREDAQDARHVQIIGEATRAINTGLPPGAAFDAVWSAAQAAGAWCAAWWDMSADGVSELLHTRGNGGGPDHILAALANCETVRRARNEATPALTSPSDDGSAGGAILAAAGLTGVFASSLSAIGGRSGTVAFATRRPGGFEQRERLLLCALAGALAGFEDRDRVAEAPESGEATWFELADAVPDVVALIDGKGVVTRLNRAFEKATGLAAEDAVGRRFSSVACFGSRCNDLEAMVADVVSGAEAVTVRTRVRSGADREALIEWRITRAPAWADDQAMALAVGVDVTERVKLQQQLARSEQLATAGELLVGVAHELNNPLTAVVGFAELLEGRASSGPEREYLATLMAQAQRSRRIVGNLLSLAREQTHHQEPSDLNDIVRRTVELLEYQLGVDDVRLTADMAPDLPPVLGIPGELQQVLINLVTNAHDALCDMGGGTVRIRTGELGAEVRVEVIDDGPGIPEALATRVFESFVTSKPEGVGTGLGLSISRQIVEQHGGAISVRTSRDGGAHFTIRLPVMEMPEIPPAPAKAPKADPEPVHSRRGGRVLVVDDEDALRLLMVEALQCEGHDVDDTDDGHEAFALIESGDYDAVLCDLKMPGMSGEDLYAQLQETHPSLARRVVFATGDTGGGSVQLFLERTGNRYIEKPFSIQDLVDAVAACIDEA